jgi:hypothetical protein
MISPDSGLDGYDVYDSPGECRMMIERESLMREAQKLTIEIDLGENGGRRLYQSIEELEQWFQSENAFWDWLRRTQWESKLNRNYLRQLRSFNLQLNAAEQSVGVQIASLGKIGEAIAAIQKQGGISEVNGASMQALLVAIYAPADGTPPKAIHAGSVAGKAVDELRKRDPVLGGGALAFFLKQRVDITSSDDAEAICRAVLYDQGIEGDAAAARKALDDVFSESTAVLAAAKRASGEHLNALSIVVSEERGNAARRKTEYEKFMADSQASVVQFVDASKKELASIEKTYNEKLALQASVSYWTNKAARHTWFAWAYGAASVLVFAAGGLALFETMKLVIGEAKVSEVQVWKLGVLVILATVVVWAIRVVVRLLMSNIHLHDDAEERRTMLLTYLALLREGSLPEGDVRQLILQALFRPAATGIIRDDAAPPFMAQWLKATTGND